MSTGDIDLDQTVEITFERVVSYSGTVSIGELKQWAEKMEGVAEGKSTFPTGDTDTDSFMESVDDYVRSNGAIFDYAPDGTWTVDSEDDAEVDTVSY